MLSVCFELLKRAWAPQTSTACVCSKHDHAMWSSLTPWWTHSYFIYIFLYTVTLLQFRVTGMCSFRLWHFDLTMKYLDWIYQSPDSYAGDPTDDAPDCEFPVVRVIAAEESSNPCSVDGFWIILRVAWSCNSIQWDLFLNLYICLGWCRHVCKT